MTKPLEDYSKEELINLVNTYHTKLMDSQAQAVRMSQHVMELSAALNETSANLVEVKAELANVKATLTERRLH